MRRILLLLVGIFLNFPAFLKRNDDQPSIGIILCKTKDNIFARRGSNHNVLITPKTTPCAPKSRFLG